MRRASCWGLVILWIGVALGGCDTGPRTPLALMERPSISPGLVVLGPAPVGREALVDSRGWEMSRRDGALGVDGASGISQLEVFEVRSTDYRWTINGRVRETSRTTTRTLRQGRLRTN
jgi:hypothetical protein